MSKISANLLLIAPSKELEETAMTAAKDLKVNLDIRVAALDQAVRLIKSLYITQYDAVISRGLTYHSLLQQTQIPVVNCETSIIDILIAIKKAKVYSNNIGLIIHEPIKEGIALLEDLFNVKITQLIPDNNEKGISECINKLFHMGINVAIGGEITTKLSNSQGMIGILLKTSYQTTYEAINKALEVSRIRKLELLKTKRIKQILDFAHEGIIAIDYEGKITVFNPTAEKIFQLSSTAVVGDELSRHIPETELDLNHVLTTGESSLAKIKKVSSNPSNVLVNKIPITINDEILGAVATVIQTDKIQNWEQKIRSKLYSKGLVAWYTLNDFVGASKETKTLKEKAKLFAQTDSTILITGETGTGKEIIAQGVHNASKRNQGPFVAVNCSALTDTLLESELFGYEEGAFTGAKKKGKVGLFELAHEGTIFLDEIGGMSEPLQAKLLRVVQEREVRKIGSDKIIPINVRIITATNKNLFDAIKSGTFREDLYYRLCILKLNIPPLRKRKEDIESFLKYFMKKYTRDVTPLINKSFINLLKEHGWPGNVRELENFTQRLCILAKDVSPQVIFEDHLSEFYSENRIELDGNMINIKKGTLKQMEGQIIEKLYEDVGENTTLLADKLNISRATAWKKLKTIKGQNK